MKNIYAALLLSSLIATFCLGWFFPTPPQSDEDNLVELAEHQAPLPDFSVYKDVKAKKRAFFEYLLPKVQYANEKILKERQWLLSLKEKPAIRQRDMNKLLALADKYEVSTLVPNKVLHRLLEHVDIIPVSLALAQAANESAWGTSRFATQGNNLFGQWCFVKGCGLVPLRQAHGQHYEVAKFDHVLASVESYMRNLNSQFSYKEFRAMRKSLRSEDQMITGLTLAEGLLSYSTRRHHYVQEIQAMILHNKLGQYDG